LKVCEAAFAAVFSDLDKNQDKWLSWEEFAAFFSAYFARVKVGVTSLYLLRYIALYIALLLY